jgi:hypothetical protein
MPVGVDHVAHQLVGDCPYGLDGLLCGGAGELGVDHHDIRVPHYDEEIRVDRQAQRVLPNRGEDPGVYRHDLQVGLAAPTSRDNDDRRGENGGAKPFVTLGNNDGPRKHRDITAWCRLLFRITILRCYFRGDSIE